MVVVAALPTADNGPHIWQYVWPGLLFLLGLGAIAAGAVRLINRHRSGCPMGVTAVLTGASALVAALAGWLEWDRLDRAARPLGLTVPGLLLLVVLFGAYMVDVGGLQSGHRSRRRGW